MRYHDIVLFLLTITNILNVFVDRSDVGGERTLIQLISGIAFIFTIIANIVNIVSKPLFFRYLTYFLGYVLLATFFSLLSPNQYINWGNYVRLAMNISLISFFYTYLESKKNIWIMYVFIFTFIFQTSVKILAGQYFSMIGSDDKAGGGDAISLGLLFVIPLVFIFFQRRLAYILSVICVIFILFSLRRTSILGLLIITYFMWPLLKKYINKKNIIFISLTTIVVFFNIWRFVEDTLTYRMTTLFLGDDNYSAEIGSYGSGRTLFWMAIISDFFKSSNVFLGNGLGSVHRFFSLHWGASLSHAHNDVIELIYTFGFVGFYLFFMFFLRLTIYIRQFSKSIENRMLIGCIVTYEFVAISTGTILRIEFLPLAISIPILLYMTKNGLKIMNK